MNPQQTEASNSNAELPRAMRPMNMPLNRLRSDEDPSPCNRDIQPYDMDVLIGIPPAEAAQHPGNRILQETVERFLEQYQRAKTKHEKMKINRCIMSTMRDQHGSRFLKRIKKNGLCWRLCDESSIRDKVSNSLRTGHQRKAKPSRGQQNSLTKSNVEAKALVQDATMSASKIQQELMALHQSQKRILHDFLGFERSKEA